MDTTQMTKERREKKKKKHTQHDKEAFTNTITIAIHMYDYHYIHSTMKISIPIAMLEPLHPSSGSLNELNKLCELIYTDDT